MSKRTQTFNFKNKDMEAFQKKVKNLLQNILNFSTTTESIISFFDKKSDNEEQEKNKIIIRQEQDKLFIQVIGNLTDGQNEILWRDLKKIVRERKEEINALKNELANKIIKIIEDKGFNLKTEDAKKFIINFLKKLDRLPKIEEIESIGYGYIEILNKEMSTENIDYETAWKEEFPEEIEESLIEALSDETEQVIKEIEEIPTEKEKIPTEKEKIPTENKIIEIKKPEGRRTCPKCGNQNITSIRELEDKIIIISDFPRLYGKNYLCGLCKTLWRER